jgi:hypothetical protein
MHLQDLFFVVRMMDVWHRINFVLIEYNCDGQDMYGYLVTTLIVLVCFLLTVLVSL